MVAEFCSKKLEEVTVIVRSQPPLMLCICVLNFLFSPMAIFGNLLVVRALWKASSIPATMKKLFMNLAFSDLAIGLFIQPTSGAILAVILNMVAKENYNFDHLCPYVITANMFFTYFLVGASFFTIAAIALDRYLAVSLHLRYQELVTEKRVGIGLVIIWLTSGLATFAFMVLPNHNEIVAVAFKTVGLLVLTVAYFRIYKVVRYHQNQIQCQSQVQNNDAAMEAAREKKSALNAFYVYMCCLGCYLPHLFARTLLAVDNLEISTLVAYYCSGFFVFLNSSLNPLVYCWRYREIRHIVKHTVERIFINNHTA